MVDVSEVGKNIYMIDDELFSIPKWGSVYVIDEEIKAVVETGPTNSVSTVLNGIKRIGIQPEDIAYIIVTHIHLDHAGGVGVLIKDMPQARVLVHHKGARHLINPAKLVRSAIEARGEEIIARHGEVLPVEMHRVQAIHDGDTVVLSEKQVLKFVDAPGHAPHELCIYETRNGGLFAGDAITVYIPEYEVLLPFHPPPHFDLKLCFETLERLAKLAPDIIYYSHFGASGKVEEHIQLAREKILDWDSIVMEAAKGTALEEIKDRLVAQACSDLESMKGVKSMNSLYWYLVEFHIPACADGHIKYYQDTGKLNAGS